MSKGRPSAHKRQAAIAGLLSCGTIGQAAVQAGICEKTLRLWMAQADFAAAYRQARQQVVEQAIGILQTASIQAVAALVRNLSSGKPGAEIAAANHLLEKSLAAVDQFDVLTRLEALEQQAALQREAYGYRVHENGEARGPGR
jgi:hypothetical protein